MRAPTRSYRNPASHWVSDSALSCAAADLLELMDSQPAGQQQHSPSPRTAGAQADGMLTSPVPSGLALADGVSR